MPSDLEEVIQSLSTELERASEPEVLHVKRVTCTGASCEVSVDFDRSTGVLDVSLEGAKAWWLEPSKGVADVLAVIPEDQIVYLRYMTAAPPREGSTLLLYPPRYLESLLNFWREAGIGHRILRWAQHFHTSNKLIEKHLGNEYAALFPWLRAGQRHSFEVLRWQRGFIHGPPGTGKTTTIGAQIAACLHHDRRKRILLVSTTNSAVDQAVIAVDSNLRQLPSLTDMVGKILRFGSRFTPARYQGREHLIPTQNKGLVADLEILQSQEPEKADAQRYGSWINSMTALRAKLSTQWVDALKGARLAAMTATRAISTIREIRSAGPWDAIFIDEASQVGMAMALALTTLAPQVIFVGDPQQLPPIARVNDPRVRKWIGSSPFMLDEGASSSVLLKEQSRMAEPICNAVSTAFYGGQLVTANDAIQDGRWLNERLPIDVCNYGRKNAYVIRLDDEAVWSQKYSGLVRLPSAQAVCKIVEDLYYVDAIERGEILVLTPYRAQRDLLKSMLQPFLGVRVSTVHAAQGSERDTVIFDPVATTNGFFLNHGLGEKLTNVAVSRARARVFVIVSPENLSNEAIFRLAHAMDPSVGRVERKPKTVQEILRGALPIESAVGQMGVFAIRNEIDSYRINSISFGKVTLVSTSTGKQRTFLLEYIVSDRDL